MIDERHRGSHWNATKRLVVFVLSVFLSMVVVIPVFYSSLGTISFLGFPLGYFLFGIGTPVVMVFLLFWMSVRQDRIDRKFGASENI